MKIFYKKQNKGLAHRSMTKGFTLTETLVATSIFTLSVLALFSNISKGISDTNLVKSRIIGAYLAQEGIEYMRNLRDTYVLYDVGGAGAGWTAFNSRLTSGSCTAANGCYFDDQNVNYADVSQPLIDMTLNACGGSCPVLLYNASSGKYNYVSGGSNTVFRRKVTVSQPNDNETIITVNVIWTYKSITESVTFKETLYKWVE